MKKSIILVGAIALALVGCQGRKSGAGLHIPNGDPIAGQATFVELGCASCHTVANVRGLPKPVATPPVNIELGGEVYRTKSDGLLMTAITNPSHKIKYKEINDKVYSGKRSRMGDYTEAMSVRELIDVIAFLHSTYEKVQPPLP